MTGPQPSPGKQQGEHRQRRYSQRELRALEDVVSLAMSYREDASERLQESIKIVDDIYHELKDTSHTNATAPGVHDIYWATLLKERVENCHACDNCTPIGKRPKSCRISDGRFDTKEKCCATRVGETGCPVSIKVKQERELEHHDATIAKAAREQVLDELRQIKQYDRIYYRTPERGKARCKVESVSTNGKRIGISYCSSSFGNGCGISKGIDLSEVVSVCREIPLRSTKEP